jgi:hypothetical protein
MAAVAHRDKMFSGKYQANYITFPRKFHFLFWAMSSTIELNLVGGCGLKFLEAKAAPKIFTCL